MTIVSKNVCWRSRQFGTSAEVSARHFGTEPAELSVLGVHLETVRCHPVLDISDAAQELGGCKC